MAINTNSKYFKYVLNNLTEIHSKYQSFVSEITDLLNKNVDDLGIVLKCHLVVEYYLDRYLKIAYPTIENWDDARLTFAQKLELIKIEGVSIGQEYQAIKNLNSLRNKFAHDFSYKILDNDIHEMKRSLIKWYGKISESSVKPINIVKDYTAYACMTIYIVMIQIEKESKEYGLPHFLKWLDAISQNDSKK